MKKIGIMSMQRIYNYGSFLQAYGLKKMVESTSDNINVTFIDYLPGKPLVLSNKKESKGIRRVLNKIKEYNEVNTSFINKLKFFNHKRTYAKRFFPLLNIKERITDTENLDVLIIGSDEVFNCVQANTNVGFSLDLFGGNSKSKRLISYAGSFGNTNWEKLTQYGIQNELSRCFKKFNGVSVRDENSLSIVKKLGSTNPQINIDPVLAYDFMSDGSIPQNRLFPNKYIIVYGYSGRFTQDENNMIKEFAKQNAFKILAFGGVQECCDEFLDVNPFELLAYFRDAEFVITDTFHGTIFSIINNISFITLIRKSEKSNYGNEEKLGFLLKQMELEERSIVTDSKGMNKSKFTDLLTSPINYIKTNEILKKERIKSFEYISDNIK